VIGCHIQFREVVGLVIVLNAHASTEDKSDESKHSFYEELVQVFNYFPKYHIKLC
jgi:hypothetical protein